jgi:hypothetical protein
MHEFGLAGWFRQGRAAARQAAVVLAVCTASLGVTMTAPVHADAASVKLAGQAAAVPVRSFPVMRPAATGSLGSTIASIAEGQEGVADNPAGTYCNPYTAHWDDGTACSNGLRATEWCADFAAWVWQQAGVSFTYGSAASDVNAGASSFYYWAVSQGTWHAAGSGYTPQAGDVAVYGSSAAGAAHVGVVVGDGSSGPDVVNGDWETSYPSTFPTAVAYQANQTSEAGIPVVGYASPPGSGSGASVVQPVSTSDGHVQLFEVSNGLVEENWYDPGSGAVGGWVSPGPMQGGAQAAGNPVVVPRAGQTVVDVFVRSSDGVVRETWYNWGTGQWGGWIPVPGATFTGDPQAVATSDGHDQVFADANGVIEENWFNPGNGAVGGWVAI